MDEQEPKPENSDDEGKKIADRPHFWTITLSVFAIAVSLLSGSVSIYSAYLTKQNYHLQNRAWLYVQDVKWESYWLRATLINRGKTPANLVEPVCRELDEYGSGGGKSPTTIGPVSLRFGPVPPEQSKDLTLGIPHDTGNSPGRRTTVRCGVNYQDVFAEKHTLALCYVLMHSGEVSVGECTDGNESR